MKIKHGTIGELSIKFGEKLFVIKILLIFSKSNLCIIGGSLGYMMSTQFYVQKHFGNIVLGLLQ